MEYLVKILLKFLASLVEKECGGHRTMLVNLDTSAAGMKARLDQQDVIANNLANASTPGFRRKSTSFQAVLEGTPNPTSAPLSTPSLVVKEDSSPGALTQTGVLSDVALDGPGFLVAKTSAGERLVRGGSFHLDSSGQMVSADGSAILGQNGPIKLSTREYIIDTSGNIVSDGKVVDTLQIRKDPSADPKATTQVVAGCIEGSNVNTIQEMVSMISTLRAYEACQKSIQSIDGTLDKVINQMQK
jgi:flagellar basal-body rod protein FlgF